MLHDSVGIVEVVLQSLRESPNYAKEKILFLLKFRELITPKEAEDILKLLIDNAKGKSKNNVFITSINPLVTIFSMLKLVKHIRR